ncbi:MAG TPA: NAD(P)-dependent alcohol dehydrogenase [Bacteriovoracaceae bacterium]|nr:NAD(P)-dependent alcohol dehydrogenase [Bacteriovoracaceae bacterium]
MTDVKAYAAFDPKKPLGPFKISRRDTNSKDVSIEIKYCGVCHSDIHQARDEWGGAIFPMVPGHEIVGLVSSVGSKVTKFKKGDKVGVGCLVNSCRDCSACREGLEQFCEKGMVGTYNSRDKDGTVTYGGYSTQITVNEDFVLRIPQSMPLDGAAPLLCAGITTYSPLKHWGAGPGKKVAIVGLGGLGHMGVKIAHALGAHVTVLSHSSKKQEDAKRLGADEFYSTADEAVFTTLGNTFDLIINTVSVKLDLNKYLGLLKRDSHMVLLGVPESPPELSAGSLIHNRRSLAGSLIGGLPETQEMLDFCGNHGITSDIETIRMDQINEAFDRMIKGDVRYRFVIDAKTI